MADLPSTRQIIDYVRTWEERGDGPPARRDVAKAFKAKGPDRAALRSMLAEMQKEGVITLQGRQPRGGASAPKSKKDLPKVAVMDVTGTDAEGDMTARPIKWDGEPPVVIVTHEGAASTTPPLGPGDRFLGRLHPRGARFEAEPIKRLEPRTERVLGVFERARRGGGVVEPVSRKAGKPLEVDKGQEAGAKDGDLVWAEPQVASGYGLRRGRIAEVVGPFGDSASWSLIALAGQDIRTEFPRAAIDEAKAATLPGLKHHEDLRKTPLITIDPSDAKDHDDAVYAERVDGGYRVLVAIADVSWFVRPGSALDEEARSRGNSVYLVDRVVPMLPEALSNGLCSLHEGEDRTALVCEMRIGENGKKRSHRFFRAMMNSRASLSYEEAQAAADGQTTKRTKPLKRPVIDPLWDAYQAMMRARAERSPLDLDLPEREIVLDKAGAVEAVVLKERFDAHKLIEAMMVAANVCAAETLEEHRRACIYRVHEAPDPERLDALRQYLETMEYSLPKGQVIKPEMFNRVLAKAERSEEADMISMSILRTQFQARYDTENLGHFGLNLSRYAHFTSPIRRYADLTVHRGIVAALALGPGGETGEDAKALGEVAEAISLTERKAIAAERETQDRFLAAFLEDKLGAEFAARVNGTNKAGLFVTLDETGADGFVPARSLGREYFEHDEKTNALVGRDTGGRYRLGQHVRVKLLEVTPLQGGLRFEMLSQPEKGERPSRGRGRGEATARPARKGRPVVTTRSGNPRTRDEPVVEAPREDKAPPPARRAARKGAASGASGTEGEARIERRPRKPKGTKVIGGKPVKKASGKPSAKRPTRKTPPKTSGKADRKKS